MPRQTKETPAAAAAQTTPAAAPAAEKKARAPRGSSKKVEEVVAAAAPVEETVVEEVEVAVEDSSRRRAAPTRESVLAEFDELVKTLDAEIARLRDSSDKNKGTKFLKSVTKSVKALQTSTTRVMKQKQPSTRKNNNSGFLKPVKLSADMAKFTGMTAEGQHSRVDVTKYICNYIRENNLQNPTDRRQIIADAKLGKLLGYDAKKAEKPLTYPVLQTLMKPHFH
jgi:upstream activation factor subunit UAF30